MKSEENSKKRNPVWATSCIVGLIIIASAIGVPKGDLVGAASGKKVKRTQKLNAALITDKATNVKRFVQLDTAPITGLVDALEARGASVHMNEYEENGLSVLKLKVDGLNLSPVISACRECEPIVFEY